MRLLFRDRRRHRLPSLTSHLLRDLGLPDADRTHAYSAAINPNLKGWV